MYVDLNLDAILQENANTKPQALNFVVLTQRQERNAKNRPGSPSTRRMLPSQLNRRFVDSIPQTVVLAWHHHHDS